MKTGKTVNLSDDAQRLEVAAEWADRLRDESASEEEILRWVQWCELDPRNQDAFDRVQAFWRVSGELAQEVRQGELIVGLAPRADPPRNWFAGSWDWLIDLLHVHRHAVTLSALMAALIFGAAVWGLRGALSWPTVADVDLIAAAAQPVRQAQLSDGSRIQLAAKSTVTVHYSEAQRDLELRDGEAYFLVAPNKHRPFVVAIGDVRVRAVGTAFNIRRAGGRVVVTVAKGIVDVYRVDANGTEITKSPDDDLRQVRVAAGDQVIWNGDNDKSPVVTAVDPAQALAWREGRLEYTDEPLEAVIADFNRYSKRPARIDADAIRKLRFSGTLLTDVTDEWLRALPQLFPVEIREQDGEYMIEPRPRATASVRKAADPMHVEQTRSSAS